jgi:hypothetical protein
MVLNKQRSEQDEKGERPPVCGFVRDEKGRKHFKESDEECSSRVKTTKKIIISETV